MSTATPMPTYRRVAAYVEQNGRPLLTARQARQANRMAKRARIRRTAQRPSAGPPPS